MEASAFDTNKYANRLVEAGVSQENANLQAEAVGEVMQAVVSLDAKVEKCHAEDLVEFASIHAQISELDAKVTKELAEQRVLIAAQDAKFTVMDAKIGSLDSRMDARISTLEKRLMRWILVVGGALGVLQSALAVVPRYLG